MLRTFPSDFCSQEHKVTSHKNHLKTSRLACLMRDWYTPDVAATVIFQNVVWQCYVVLYKNM